MKTEAKLSESIFELNKLKCYTINNRGRIMNTKDILDFKASLINMSVDELEKVRVDLNAQITKMILDTDLITKVAIVETLITDKLQKETADGTK